MHAQQIPGAPPQPIPALGALGPLGAFAGPMAVPHGHQALLKLPQELQREDIKVPLGGPSADERLVSIHDIFIFEFFLLLITSTLAVSNKTTFSTTKFAA